jgi:hypothetical protein
MRLLPRAVIRPLPLRRYSIHSQTTTCAFPSLGPSDSQDAVPATDSLSNHRTLNNTRVYLQRRPDVAAFSLVVVLLPTHCLPRTVALLVGQMLVGQMLVGQMLTSWRKPWLNKLSL